MDYRDSQFLKFGFDQDLIPKLNLRFSNSKKVKHKNKKLTRITKGVQNFEVNVMIKL